MYQEMYMSQESGDNFSKVKSVKTMYSTCWQIVWIFLK